MPETYIPTKEAAKILGVHVSTLLAWGIHGPKRKVGRRGWYTYLEDSVVNWPHICPHCNRPMPSDHTACLVRGCPGLLELENRGGPKGKNVRLGRDGMMRQYTGLPAKKYTCKCPSCGELHKQLLYGYTGGLATPWFYCKKCQYKRTACTDSSKSTPL